MIAALMAFLLRIIFSVIAALANLLSFVLARAIALLVVASFRLLSLPGEVLGGALAVARELLVSTSHHALALLGAALLSLVTGFVETAAGCFVVASSRLDELLLLAKIATGEFFVEVFRGAVEMVAVVAHNASSNCMDAMRFVMNNA